MSIYQLEAEDPDQRIEVGWAPNFGGYWATVWEPGDFRDPLSRHGLDELISNVYDLLARIRGYLPDHISHDVIRDLLEDPWREAAGSSPTYPELAELLAEVTAASRASG